jgi:hypothetical protein
VDHTDLPLSSTFGPRQQASYKYRYDYHRGIDMPTPVGTPVFAMTDGDVRIAGYHSAYADKIVQIRHYRPGYTSCRNVGCYHTNYIHLDSVVVSKDQSVNKGDLIGYTGKSSSGFAHLHFEIRSAPSHDPYSAWQRDAIHPLQVLPYRSTERAMIGIDVQDADSSSPNIKVSASSPRVDIIGARLTLYDMMGNVIEQAGNAQNAKGYNVNPSWFEMNAWNTQYTHVNSRNYPWESFVKDGKNSCPYHADHGRNYDANVHLDQHAEHNYSVGSFNGVLIAPGRYGSLNNDTYILNLTFTALQGPVACVKAEVLTTTDSLFYQTWGDGSCCKQGVKVTKR